MERDNAERVVIDSGFLDGEPPTIRDVDGYFTRDEFTRMFDGDPATDYRSYSSADWEDIRVAAREAIRRDQ